LNTVMDKILGYVLGTLIPSIFVGR